ncbi:alginate export family protein [Bradyrhizobium sp. S3.9.1]|uniref:alginate export family protein n=1 Tax=Bradyrhizobium sp. S3.9.1 TaxID=3156431 RepID=UPI003395204F
MAFLLGRLCLRREWAAGVLCLAAPQMAWADDQKSQASTPQRPTIMFNRWQEEWSVLADPRVPREPLDEFKYLPLGGVDPYTYLSFGANTRERFESNNAANFGTGPNRSQNYVISRNEFHADLRVDNRLQAFVQFQADYAPWKTMLTPVDRDRLDLEQAWVALTEPVGGGTLKLRAGRQQFGFDLQRFVAVRDGPNVRQSFDAAWADYEHGPWRFITFYSLPVQVRDVTIFDDYSSLSTQTFGMARAEYKFSESLFIAGYYANFTQGNVQFPNASGNERRDIFDVHLNGTANHFDFDLEVMNQTGRIGVEPIEAWAVGSLAGYTFADVNWSPRVGIQFDAASGDGNTKQTFGTFNPLFPNGYYFTLAGYTGYTNLIHIKPSLTLSPTSSLKIAFAVAAQWRQNTADAVYTQPDIAIPNTAGHPGAYTGSYGQVRLDWTIDRATSFAVEAVHFVVGDALRNAGAHDSNYIGVEIKRGW